MKTSIVKIGNSQGIRIPKHILAQADINTNVELELKNGGLLITPIVDEENETMLLSEAALAKDWRSKEEDEAWAHLQ